MVMLSEIRPTRMLKQRDGSCRLWVESVSLNRNVKRYRNQKEYAERYKSMLESAADATRIDIYMNSIGGSVDSALGLMEALQSGTIGKIEKRMLITGLCGSAATLFAGMNIPIYIAPTGRIHIHMAKDTSKRGNTAWSRLASWFAIDYVTRLMISCYRGRAKKNGKKLGREKLVEWMRGPGMYFTAAEAVEVGICDGIMSQTGYEKGA